MDSDFFFAPLSLRALSTVGSSGAVPDGMVTFYGLCLAVSKYIDSAGVFSSDRLIDPIALLKPYHFLWASVADSYDPPNLLLTFSFPGVKKAFCFNLLLFLL